MHMHLLTPLHTAAVGALGHAAAMWHMHEHRPLEDRTTCQARSPASSRQGSLCRVRPIGASVQPVPHQRNDGAAHTCNWDILDSIVVNRFNPRGTTRTWPHSGCKRSMYAHLTAGPACCEAGSVGGLADVSFGVEACLPGAGSCPSTHCASWALHSVSSCLTINCARPSLRERWSQHVAGDQVKHCAEHGARASF